MVVHYTPFVMNLFRLSQQKDETKKKFYYMQNDEGFFVPFDEMRQTDKIGHDINEEEEEKEKEKRHKLYYAFGVFATRLI